MKRTSDAAAFFAHRPRAAVSSIHGARDSRGLQLHHHQQDACDSVQRRLARNSGYNDHCVLAQRYRRLRRRRSEQIRLRDRGVPINDFNPSTGSNCAGDIRIIQEPTVGFWYKFYQGSKGRVQWGLQYSYLTKDAWAGNIAGVASHPKGVDNML
jgi:hypothetical protein